MAKKEKWIVYTPLVELSYCWIMMPDSKFGDPTYKAEFLLTPEQAKQFASNLEGDPRAAIDGKKMKLKGTQVDGKIKFRAKQARTLTWKDKATGETQTKDIQPKVLQLVDGETIDYKGGYPMPGSTGEFELEVVPYTQMGGGLSLRLRGVRLHDVIEGAKSDGGDSWGEPAFDGAPITPTDHGAEPEDAADDDRNW